MKLSYYLITFSNPFFLPYASKTSPIQTKPAVSQEILRVRRNFNIMDAGIPEQGVLDVIALERNKEDVKQE